MEGRRRCAIGKKKTDNKRRREWEQSNCPKKRIINSSSLLHSSLFPFQVDEDDDFFPLYLVFVLFPLSSVWRVFLLLPLPNYKASWTEEKEEEMKEERKEEKETKKEEEEEELFL